MKRFNITKDKIVIFVLSGIFALLASNNIFHIQDIISVSIPIILVIGLFIIAAFLTFHAGLIIVKSLMLVATELSLIIFLAQSYCAPGISQTASGDKALLALLILGLSYVAYLFLSKVNDELKAQAKRFREVDNKWSGEAVSIFILLIIFVVVFAVAILEVITPIISGLCI